MLTALALGGFILAIFLRYWHIYGFRMFIALLGMTFLSVVMMTFCFWVGFGASFIFHGTSDAERLLKGNGENWWGQMSLTSKFEPIIKGTQHALPPTRQGCTPLPNGDLDCPPVIIEGKEGVIWPIIFAYPVTLPTDFVRWMTYQSIHYGNWTLWLVEIFGLMKIFQMWINFIRRTIENWELDRPPQYDRTPRVPKKWS